MVRQHFSLWQQPPSYPWVWLNLCPEPHLFLGAVVRSRAAGVLCPNVGPYYYWFHRIHFLFKKCNSIQPQKKFFLKKQICGCAGSLLPRRLFFSCGVRASHCSGFSCCRAWTRGHKGFSSCSPWAQYLWHSGLVAPWPVVSSWTRD